jgi:hypothetical protein
MLLTWCLLFGLVRIRLTAMRKTTRPDMLCSLCLALPDFELVRNLETAREIWSTLERYHEGTSHVKTTL